MLSLEGQQLGNYDVIRRIRVGGMGAVYEGRQRTAFDRRVAIKVILGDYANDKDMRRRFAREARAIARLHHPHILQLIEFNDERGILYLVMPFIDGGTLTSYLRRTLPGLEEVSAIYQQLLDAVEYAHEEGLIHRDIKSSNILLEQTRPATDGTGSRPPYVYLADFGLVRPVYQHDPQQVGKPIPLDQVPGTPHYMAPEQTLGIITPLNDIYALGVLLYQLLTGELPYDDPDDIRVIEMHLHDPIPSPCEHDASIPSELATVIRKAMAKNPEERYQTVDELRQAFLDAVKGPTAPPETPDDATIIEEPLPIKHHTPTPLTLRAPAPRGPDAPKRPTPASPTGKLGAPFLVPRRPRKDASTATTVHSRHGKLGGSSKPPKRTPPQQASPRPATQRPHISELMTRKQGKNRQPLGWRKRALQFLLVCLIVTVLLAGVLFASRASGIKLPVSIPYINEPPIGTVYITPKIQTLQNTFVLTASSQVNQADFVTHTIPDRQWQASASDTISVPTTGTQTIGGAQARGTLIFNNTSNQSITLPAGFTLTTPTGTHLQLIEGITIPQHQKGQDGKASEQAQVIDAGQAGNLIAHSVDSPCCGAGITVSNPTPFTGGQDGQIVHVLQQSDLDAARATLLSTAEQQIQQQIQQRLTPDDVLTGPPTYNSNLLSSDTMGAQVDHVQVTLNVIGSAVTYSGKQAGLTALQLLNKQAIETLDSNYHAQGAAAVVGQPKVEAGRDGMYYVSIQVSGNWIYQHTKQQIGQWTQAVRGATAAAAEAYLKEQPGVSTVQIALPFGNDRLPTSYNQIKIVLVKPGGQG
ncbi:MAG TPA: protein kinase [Ktedonosporobacter sp.]|nr:protein kinase [Ktedonosporobacter sp.]